MPPLRVRVLITGSVQGVWFRESTRRMADELGLGGYVRNLPDGRVEAVFEGEVEAVRRAVAWAHEGPPQARVTEVASEESATEGPPQRGPFRIRRTR